MHMETPCAVHKNVSLYCVEFQCTKKQTILLLEICHEPYYSKFQRFSLLASFYSSSAKPQWSYHKNNILHVFLRAPVLS